MSVCTPNPCPFPASRARRDAKRFYMGSVDFPNAIRGASFVASVRSARGAGARSATHGPATLHVVLGALCRGAAAPARIGTEMDSLKSSPWIAAARRTAGASTSGRRAAAAGSRLGTAILSFLPALTRGLLHNAGARSCIDPKQCSQPADRPTRRWRPRPRATMAWRGKRAGAHMRHARRCDSRLGAF